MRRVLVQQERGFIQEPHGLGYWGTPASEAILLPLKPLFLKGQGKEGFFLSIHSSS